MTLRSAQRLHLVRHGQTAFSARGAYSGQMEIALTSTGRDQARRAGERLSGAGIDAIRSSPLSRARDTAQAIAAATGAAFAVDERLTEVGFGPLEGLDREAAQRRFGTPFADWRADPFGSPLPGTEPLGEALERARAATADILDSCDAPVIVAHQGILRLVLVALGRIEPDDYFSTRLREAEPMEVVAPRIRCG